MLVQLTFIYRTIATIKLVFKYFKKAKTENCLKKIPVYEEQGSHG